MSKGTSKEIEFHCTNGCEAYGDCPGHKMRAEFDRSMDYYSFFVDGKRTHVFGEDEWIAMNKAVEDIK